jgi:catechol 2,3-dioxygenase-like lactoylglutathione lyase family enzyme
MPTITGFMHVNVNCTDLARSRAFYGDTLGLITSAHTKPDRPQPGAAFGLDGDALWDAYVLDDPRGMGVAASLDLLRWEEPAPCGAPPGFTPMPGIHRVAYAVPSLDAALGPLTAAGRGARPPATVQRGAEQARVAWVLDPDGSAIELIEDTQATDPVRAHAVTIVCRDLERAAAWYEHALGLTVIARERDARGPGASFGTTAEARWDAAVLELPQRPGQYALRLEQWHAPALIERPRAVANQLGPFRVAFLVDDARAWHAELARRGVTCTADPAWLDMGPEIPLDGLWALFFFDPDGACVEMIEVPS